MADLPRDVIDTLIAEAYAEGPEGMRRVAETIINRAAVRGLTPEQVVRQAHQYTGYEHPGSGAKRAQRSTKARTAAEAAWNLALQPGDPTGGADHYLNPAQANPSWASKLPSTGTYGNHKFFASRPIPAGEIENVVGTLTDTVPPRAVTPVTSSPDLAQMRRTAMPSRLIADSFASLPQQRPRSTLADSIGFNPIQGGQQTAQPFDAAFDTRLGAMRMLNQPETVSSQGLGIGTSPGPRTMLPPVPPSAMGQRQQSQIERGTARTVAPASLPRVTVSTPYTTPQSNIERGAPRSVAQSPIGQPPATRTVQSVPMPPLPSASNFVPEARYIEPRNPSPASPPQYAGPFVPHPTIPSANGTIIANKPQDRLAPGGMNNAPDTLGPLAGYSAPPLPMPPIRRAEPPTAVATLLDTRAMPPLPRRRPDFGIGGVDVLAPIAQTGQVAPVPMPRLQRGGIFGKPQIFGHDIPLPGIFGILQNATRGMNNASGPFNNGAENSIYQLMRGGNQSRPSTATAQAGGFLYAPNPNGGGLVNVGRAPNYSNPDRFGQGGVDDNGAVQPRGTIY